VLQWMIGADGTELVVRQRMTQPAVYFDHWALRLFSEDAALRTRFVNAMRRRRGCLLVSWLNCVEFAKVSTRQAELAEGLLEALLPNLFFIEAIAFDVIAREDQLFGGGRPDVPQSDDGLLQAFAGLAPSGVAAFTAHGLFTAVAQSKIGGMDGLADTIIERIQTLRIDCDSDPGFQRLACAPPSADERPRGTRTVVRELLRGFLLDTRLCITQQHAIDFMHAAVPVAYADLVLLDKHWNDQVKRVHTRFAKAELAIPLALTFSRRNDGLEQFLGLLE
jgi:hypothetical protein